MSKSNQALYDRVSEKLGIVEETDLQSERWCEGMTDQVDKMWLENRISGLEIIESSLDAMIRGDQ